MAECCSRVKASVNTLKSTPVRLLTRSVFVKNQGVICFPSKLFFSSLGKVLRRGVCGEKEKKEFTPQIIFDTLLLLFRRIAGIPSVKIHLN